MRDQVLIRDEIFGVIACHHRDVASAERPDPAIGLTHRNDVARLNRAVEQQNHAADEIRYYPLQAKADANANCAAEYSEGGEIDADTAERDCDCGNREQDLEELAD